MAKKMIRDFREIFLDIYLMGYPIEGESIVCCLRTDNENSPFLFTSVIDCYRNEECNYTVELLKRLKISKLDLLCWTHPDKDHSLGIDELLQEYVGANTVVSIPISLIEHMKDFNEETQKYFQIILNRLNTRKSEHKIRLQSTCNNTEVYARDYLKINQDKSYSLRIKAIAPDSNLVAHLLNRKTVKNNIFSIALCLNFEELNVLFTGDLENNTIRNIKDMWDLPDNFHYIKIPHHGASSSSDLIDVLESQKESTFIGNIACSTVFKKAGLPEKEILKKYENIVEKVICTGDIINSNPVAMIHSVFDISSQEYSTVFEEFTRMCSHNRINYHHKQYKA